MYGADVSPTLISKATDAVKEQVTEWQNRRLAMSRIFIEFDDRLSDHLYYIGSYTELLAGSAHTFSLRVRKMF